MSIIRLYRDAAAFLEEAFHELASRQERPQMRDFGFGTAHRYPTDSLEAAAVQKLARVVSGLNACLVLLEKGFVQEIGALQRMLDEFCEDLFFLCQPLLGGERTLLHDEYLRYFYQEEIDSHGNPFLSEQKRPQISRSKIHAANARTNAEILNPSDTQELMRSLNKANSGFVHGASPHIMEMYGGDPPRFHVAGMLGTARIEECEKSLWHYFHRGINSAGLVALGLQRRDVCESIMEVRSRFEDRSGKSASGRASELMAKVKAPKER